MQRQPRQPGAQRGDGAVVHRADILQRILCLRPGIVRRLIRQREVCAATPRGDHQGGLGEIGRGNLRGDVGCRMLIIRQRIGANHGAGALTAGAARALIHRGLRRGHRDQASHASRSIPARYAGKTRIDHHAHSWHGQGGLRNGGGHDNPGRIRRSQRLVLLGVAQPAMQRQRAGNLRADLLDFAYTGDKTSTECPVISVPVSPGWPSVSETPACSQPGPHAERTAYPADTSPPEYPEQTLSSALQNAAHLRWRT